MDEIKVSIIIPIYNVEAYIERCLLSVFKQTYKNIEIVLVDDKSPDNSVDIALGLISEYDIGDKVKLMRHDVNKGLSVARNTGTISANGEYIFFLDSDDDLPQDAIELLVACIPGYDTDFVIGNILEINLDVTDQVNVLCNSRTSNQEILNSFFKNEWYVMACNKLLNRKFILDNNLFFEEGIYHEDNLWSFLLALNANKMDVCQHITYHYYRNVGSITSNIKPKNITDLIYIFKEIIFYCQSKYYLDNALCLSYIENFRFYILIQSLSLGFQPWKKYYTEIEKDQILKTVIYQYLSFKYKCKRWLDDFPRIIVFNLYKLFKAILKNRKS